MHRSARLYIGFGLLTAIAAAACGGNTPEPQTANNQQMGYQQQQQYPQQQQQYPQQQQQYPQQTPATAQPGAVPQTGAPAAGATQGATAQQVDASMAAPIQAAVQQLGRTQAPPGAKAMGNLIVANFAQGQTFEQTIQLQANKCYTVVAAGVPGVNEVNIKLMPPVIPTTLAQDNSTGPQATLGQNPNCWKNGPIPAPMRVVFEVPSGQGIVAAQIYEK